MGGPGPRARPETAVPSAGECSRGARGIEVSQVFQLGTKYSESMGATFADENGDEQPFIMGCYGVGVSRTLAAVIEQHSDEAGIIWPVGVAPLEVAVLPLMADGEVAEVAERLWRELAEAGVETVIDDRDERAGVKFNDADLVGWPFQLVVGKQRLAEGVVELKVRETGERTARCRSRRSPRRPWSHAGSPEPPARVCAPEGLHAVLLCSECCPAPPVW